MAFFRAALFAALSLCGLPVMAQDVTFTSRDGSIELDGTLLGFDGEYYRVETVYGELTLDASGVLCEGPGCPDLEDFVADLRLSGASAMGRVLIPALIEAFALRVGLTVTRQTLDQGDTVFLLADADQLRGRFQLRATNTDEGFADLLAGEADIAMATREIRPKEVQQARDAGLGDLTHVNRSRVLALDGLVAVTAPGHPVSALSLEQLSQIFAGEITNWRDLGGPDAPIELHAPDVTTGFSQAMEDALMAPAQRQAVAGIQRHATPAAVARAVERDYLGIGIGTYAARGSAQVVTLSGTCGFSLQADRRTIKTEDYPLTAPLFLYLPARRLPKLARDFLSFTRTGAAQIVMRRAGFVDQDPEAVPLNAQGDRFANAISVAGPEVPLTELQRMVAALSHRARLTTSFRFEPGAIRLDAQSRSNVQQLARALEAGMYDGREITFVGFSDGAGGADANRKIAERRADTVRRAVQEAAQTANFNRATLSIEAFGEAMPMACDDTAWGRGVNRRVEVWLR